MTNIIGPDVSFYQDDPQTVRQVDFAKTRTLSEYVIIRAGQNLWMDPDFDFNWREAKRAGLRRGSYWFFDSRVDPTEQAEKWIQGLAGDLGEMELFADFEEEYGGPFRGWRNWRAFLERLMLSVPTSKIAIYTAFFFWKDHAPDPVLEADDLEFFHQFKLWIANYTSSPAPAVPEPWAPDEWLFWQFTDEGPGAAYGAESSHIDLNYFHGDLAAFRARYPLDSGPPTPFPPLDLVTVTHDGIVLHELQRFGCRCLVHEIDLTKVRPWVTDGGFRTVGAAVSKYGAQLGFNGGGWPNVQTPGHRSNEIWASDGRILQATSLDDRGYINVTKDRRVSISENDRIDVATIFNAWGFDRILGKDGQFNTAISDRVTKDARTGSGITSDGRLLILSAEGDDRFQVGLTFPEMWAVLSEFGAVIAGNNDGGSSSCAVNMAISPDPMHSLIEPSDGHQANVINQVLFFAQPIDGEPPDPEPIPPEGGSMQTFSSTVDRALRSDHSAAAGRIGTIPANFICTVDETFTAPADVKDSSGKVIQKAGDIWAHCTKMEGGGTATVINGWTAVVHLGVSQGTLSDAGTPPAPGPVHVTHVIEVWSDGGVTLDGVHYPPT